MYNWGEAEVDGRGVVSIGSGWVMGVEAIGGGAFLEVEGVGSALGRLALAVTLREVEGAGRGWGIGWIGRCRGVGPGSW